LFQSNEDSRRNDEDDDDGDDEDDDEDDKDVEEEEEEPALPSVVKQESKTATGKRKRPSNEAVDAPPAKKVNNQNDNHPDIMRVNLHVL
jgi:hypothetical protein